MDNMVALSAEMLQKIKGLQDEIEPLIIDMIKGSDEPNCPYRVMREGNPESKDTREVVTKVARMLYQHGLIDKLSISLSDDTAYDTILYAFGYWGGKTLYKHGNMICKCKNKCY